MKYYRHYDYNSTCEALIAGSTRRNNAVKIITIEKNKNM